MKRRDFLAGVAAFLLPPQQALANSIWAGASKRHGLPGRTVLPVNTIYVSNVNYGGMPVGNDGSGDGSWRNPYRTIETGFARAGAGQCIALNGNPASPTKYRHATLLTINKSTRIESVFAYGAKICAQTGTVTRVINVTVSGGNITIGKVIIDAEGFYNSCVTYSDTAAPIAIAFNGTWFRDWTLQGASVSVGTSTRLSASYNDCIFTAGNCRAAISHLGLIEGGVRVSGGTISLSAQSLSGQGPIVVMALAASVFASFKNIVINNTLSASLTSTGTHIGIYVRNIPSVLVSGCIVNMLGAPGSRKSIPIYVSPSLDGNARDSGLVIITGNSLYNEGNGGALIEIGDDGATADLQDACIIQDNICTGSAAFVAGGGHAIFACIVTNAIIRRNRIDLAAIGLVDKLSIGNSWYNNVVTRCTSNYALMKGSTNPSMKHNTLHSSTGYAAFHLTAEVGDDVGTTDTTGGVFEGNLCSHDTSAGAFWISVDANQVVTFTTNDYYSGNATFGSNPWRYQGVNQTDLSGWQGAQEASAVAIDPQYRASDNFDITPSVVGLDIVANDASIPSDYLRRTFANPATVGAYQRQAA